MMHSTITGVEGEWRLEWKGNDVQYVGYRGEGVQCAVHGLERKQTNSQVWGLELNRNSTQYRGWSGWAVQGPYSKIMASSVQWRYKM